MGYCLQPEPVRPRQRNQDRIQLVGQKLNHSRLRLPSLDTFSHSIQPPASPQRKVEIDPSELSTPRLQLESSAEPFFSKLPRWGIICFILARPKRVQHPLWRV